MLGLFLLIQAAGWSASTLLRSTDCTFDYNAALVRQIEDLGFDLAFGLSQWLPKGGYGGVLTVQALDSFIALTAMAAITRRRRIMLISTVHVLYGPWHPLHFAKFGATLDHISKGRWGVNIVIGHRAVEHEMFGWSRVDHDCRYELTLDVTVQAHALELLDQLRRDTSMALPLITHDLGIGADLHYRNGPLPEIADNIVSATGVKGFAFAPRCSSTRPSCWTERPNVAPIDRGHAVACSVDASDSVEPALAVGWPALSRLSNATWHDPGR